MAWRRPTAGLLSAQKAARERFIAGMSDREAANRYRLLVASGSVTGETAADYLDRAAECDRLASAKLRSGGGWGRPCKAT